MASSAVRLFFCFAGMVLLIFVCVSAPTWENVSFLDVHLGERVIHFGLFGYTGTKRSVGYSFDPNPSGFSGTRLNTAINHNLTSILVLYPIAAGLSGINVLLGLCGVVYLRTRRKLITMTLAALVMLVVWIVSMVLFGIARNRFRHEGVSAEYGNANWLGLGAFIALLLALFIPGDRHNDRRDRDRDNSVDCDCDCDCDW